MSDKSLFEQIGGAPAVKAAVEIFYDRVLADPFLKPHFESTDMDLQRQKQARFMAYALGAPTKYEGASMRDAHAHLDINDEHFDSVCAHLTATLEQLGVEQSLITQVGTIVESAREDVLGRR